MERTLEDAMRRALARAPGSRRSLALEARVSPSLLDMIAAGDRRPSRATIEAVAAACERLAARHAEAARILRDTLTTEE